MWPGVEIRGGGPCKALRETEPDLALRDGSLAEHLRLGHGSADCSAKPSPQSDRLGCHGRAAPLLWVSPAAPTKVLASLGAPVASTDLPDGELALPRRSINRPRRDFARVLRSVGQTAENGFFWHDAMGDHAGRSRPEGHAACGVVADECPKAKTLPSGQRVPVRQCPRLSNGWILAMVSARFTERPAAQL